MEKENAVLEFGELEDLDSFNLDELESTLQGELESQLSELSFLEEEREKIGNPDSLGKTILDEVWKQFGNQIGLDMTNETLIQKYDREHPEAYSEIRDSIMKDKRYTDANKAMKEQQDAGVLKDEYTGKDLKRNDKANLDHVVPRKELYDNQRRKQANLDAADLANKEENLKPTNESLNKSKKEKSNEGYIEYLNNNEEQLRKECEKKKKKIDESDMYDVDKRLAKEKLDKRLNDKFAADSELMKQTDKEARKAINKDIRTNAAKQIGKKAGLDALKTMVISALFSFLKEVMNGLIRFLKSKSKSFNGFLAEMRESIKSFFSKIMSVIQTGASTLVGTIISEIFGPIVSLFRKLASLIKQGVSSVIDAIAYLSNKENKDKPLSVKVAQVGNIMTAAIVSGGALFLGELFEKILLGVPGMAIEIPLVGSLANLIGLFLSSLVCGVIGAIIINLIDKFIAKKQQEENTNQQVQKGNEILDTQAQLIDINREKLGQTKRSTASSISDRHHEASKLIKESLDHVFSKEVEEDNEESFDEMNEILRELLD